MEKYLIGVFLIFLIHNKDLVLAQDPEITETILPDIKEVGLTGRLDCVVINQLDNPVYWIHKDTQLHISKDDTIEIDDVHNTVDQGMQKFDVEKYVDGDKVTYQLIINRLERRDSGLYTCQILVRGSSFHPTKDGEIIVLVPPSIIQTSTSNTVTADEGDSMNLTCNADGYPSPNVTWVRVNGHVLPSGILRHQGKVFPIANIKTEDRGIYRCLADNAVRPPAVYDTTVLVFFKPKAKAVQSSYGQAENRMFDITIECTVAGYPEPDLQWYKELSGGVWDPINNNDDFTVNILLNHANILSPQERWFQLVIRSVTANDFGNYICEGRNNHGTGYSTVNLFATSECQGPNCPEEQQPEGNSAICSLWSSKTFISSILILIFTSKML